MHAHGGAVGGVVFLAKEPLAAHFFFLFQIKKGTLGNQWQSLINSQHFHWPLHEQACLKVFQLVKVMSKSESRKRIFCELLENFQYVVINPIRTGGGGGGGGAHCAAPVTYLRLTV